MELTHYSYISSPDLNDTVVPSPDLQWPLYARNLGIATDSSSERMANSYITRLWSKGTRSIHSRLCDPFSFLLELSRTSCSSFSHSHVVSFSASRPWKQPYRSLRVQTPARVRPRSSDYRFYFRNSEMSLLADELYLRLSKSHRCQA